MTIDEALAEVTTEVDAHLAVLRRRFEDRLIRNHAPAQDLELLLDWHEGYQQAWRARTLAALRVEMRAALLDPSGWEPVEPRDPSEAP